MPYTELLKWITFFSKRPVGWREDHRTYMLLSAQGVKEKAGNLFPSLKAINKAQEDLNQNGALPTGKFLEHMIRAKNGDGSGWTPSWGNKKDG